MVAIKFKDYHRIVGTDSKFEGGFCFHIEIDGTPAHVRIKDDEEGKGLFLATDSKVFEGLSETVKSLYIAEFLNTLAKSEEEKEALRKLPRLTSFQ